MIHASQLGFEPHVVLDHVSPYGPVPTHMRGILLTNSLENLRAANVYEAYLTYLPEAQRDAIIYTLANTWVPMELAVAHYAACDQLALSVRDFEEMGEKTASRVASTFLGGALRKARQLGFESFHTVMSRVGALNERLYQGGHCVVIATGPKDLVFEIVGYPHAQSRFFRMNYISYCGAAASLFCKVAFAKQVRARVPHPHTLAIQMSWV